jgi:trehalose 6-phosphate synthase
MRQRVLLASNRGPFSYWFGADGTLIGRRGGGGLISGMTPGVAAVAAQAEVIWICAAFTDADRTAAHRWGAGSEDPADPPATL